MKLKLEKRIIPLVSIVLFSFVISPLSGQNYQNEFKINALYAAFTIVDLHYERHTSGRFSYGANVDVNLRWDEYLASAVLFGRVYSNEKYKEFFLEIHHAIHLDGSCIDKQVVYHIGPSIGYKFLLQKNYTLELLGGVGFHYSDIKCRELGNLYFPRLGILIGKRF